MSEPSLVLRRPADPLTDGVVTLDRFTRDDVVDIVRAIDDEILRWLPLPDPYGETEARGFVAAPPNTASEGAALNFAIRCEARLAGSVGVSISRPRTGEVEVGYWVAPHARHQGVALRAVLLVAGHALAAEGVERLEILCHPDNRASRHVAERAGAQFEGIRRHGLPPPPRQGSTDAAVYALLPEDVAAVHGDPRSGATPRRRSAPGSR
ncbi:MAG: GNAT family N-acetyltransferase [Egibacteraceae bacterium]